MILRQLIPFLYFVTLSFAVETLISKEFATDTFTVSAFVSWSSSSVYTCNSPNYIDFDGKTLCGVFGLGTDNQKVFSLPPHWSLSLRVDLVLFCTYDSPDYASVEIDSTEYGRYKKLASEGVQLCSLYPDYPDVIVMFHKNITHTAATTTISIVSVTDEVLINEGLLYKNFFLYVDECFPTCLTCNGPSYKQCLTCPANSRFVNDFGTQCYCNNGYLVHQHTCVLSCPAGYVISAQQNWCVVSPCDANCSSCSLDLQSCLSCNASYYLEKGYCVTSCSFTATASSGVCVDIITTLGLINGAYLIKGLMNQSFGQSEINGLKLSVSGFVGNRGSSDSTAMTSQCSETYHLLGGVYLAGVGAIIRGSWTGIDAHWSLVVGFKFMRIDTWDNEILYLSIDSIQYNMGTYIGTGGVNYCGISSGEVLYSLSKNITHTSSSLSIQITSNLDSSPYDESWGIREIYILIDYCVDNCTVCNASGCLTCASGYFMYMMKCVFSCPIGSYKSSASTCDDCLPSCKTCIGPANCSSCFASTYLSSNFCVLTCPTSFWPDDITGICQPCPNSCKKCISPGDQFSCTNCVSSYYLYLNQCLSLCPYGTFSSSIINNHQCFNCHSTCATCFTSGPIGCLTCTSPRYYQQSTNQCQTVCDSNQYIDTTLLKCADCDTSCTSCSGPLATQCLSCSGSLYLDLNTNKCNITCKSNQFSNFLNNQCQPCDLTCKTCTGNQPTDCLSCSYPLYYQPLTGSCVSACNLNQYSVTLPNPKCNDCDITCTTCFGSSNSQCLSCSGTLYLEQSSNQCIPTCSTNSYIDIPNQKCSPCYSTCTTCSGPLASNCQTCTLPYYFQTSQNSCVQAADCLSTQYPDNALDKCMSCHSSCLTCSGKLSTNCLTCSGSQRIDTNTNECVQFCLSGYSIFDSTGICRPCYPSCLTCSGSDYNQCLTCKTSLYSYGQSCLSECPKNTFLEVSSKQCLQCNKICVKSCTGLFKEDCNEIQIKYQIIVYLFFGVFGSFLISGIFGSWIDNKDQIKKQYQVAPNIHEGHSQKTKAINKIGREESQNDQLQDKQNMNIKIESISQQSLQFNFNQEEVESNLKQPKQKRGRGYLKNLFNIEAKEEPQIIQETKLVEVSPSPPPPLLMNQKLKFSILGIEWISLFYFYDPSTSRLNRACIIYLKHLALFFVCEMFCKVPLFLAASCIMIGFSYKYLVGILMRILQNGALWSNEILSAIFGLIFGGTIYFWFLPKIEVLSLNPDRNWSLVYVIASGADIVIQPLFGLMSYIITLKYLNLEGKTSIFYKIFLNNLFLNKLKEDHQRC